MIELIKLTKKFGARLAVDDLTLNVPAGEIFGLLGHNGAGQTWPSIIPMAVLLPAAAR